MERQYWLTEGSYRNISLLPVPCTDSLNSLAEALRLYIYIYIYTAKSVNEAELFTAFSHTMSSYKGAVMFGHSHLSSSVY